MFQSTDYKDLIHHKNNLFIDLRSEKEFHKETIPGAINMPILNDQEHKEVSTLYVQKDPEVAKAKAIEYASGKIAEYFKFISENKEKYQIVLFCARGGYRSTVLFNVLRSLHEDVYKLNLGYKGYRQFVLNHLEEQIERFTFINLNGYTGTGKTEILDALKNKVQVLDLEGLANHRGSLLGAIGRGAQPSQKMFESLLFETLRSFEKPYVIVESESVKIGNVYLPKALYEKYKSSSYQILIESPMDIRVERIRKDYLSEETRERFDEVEKALNRMNKYICPERLEKYHQNIRNGQINEVIKGLMEKYYDKNYAIKTKQFEKIYCNKNSKETAQEIYRDFKQLFDQSCDKVSNIEYNKNIL